MSDHRFDGEPPAAPQASEDRRWAFVVDVSIESWGWANFQVGSRTPQDASTVDLADVWG